MKKYLILGTGRCGSTLLSAILSHSGANFGIIKKSDWDKRGGYYEHPLAHKAQKWYSRAEKIRSSIIPDFLGYRHCVNKCRNYISILLNDVDYVKSTHLHKLVHIVNGERGYNPVVIGIWREPLPQIVSRAKAHGNTCVEALSQWFETNQNILLLLNIFPGCLIKFEHLKDSNNIEWSESLANLTGLERENLVDARNKLLDVVNREFKVQFTLPSNIVNLKNDLEKYTNAIF